MIARLMLVGLAFAGGAAAGALWLDGGGITPAADGPVPPVVRQNDPEAGGPPVVWVSGLLGSVGPDRIVLREGDGPRVVLRRFAEGATSFHRLDGRWREVSAEGSEGQPACIEALLDDGEFLALRVFVGAGCSPVP